MAIDSKSDLDVEIPTTDNSATVFQISPKPCEEESLSVEPKMCESFARRFCQLLRTVACEETDPSQRSFIRFIVTSFGILATMSILTPIIDAAYFTWLTIIVNCILAVVILFLALYANNNRGELSGARIERLDSIDMHLEASVEAEVELEDVYSSSGSEESSGDESNTSEVSDEQPADAEEEYDEVADQQHVEVVLSAELLARLPEIGQDDHDEDNEESKEIPTKDRAQEELSHRVDNVNPDVSNREKPTSPRDSSQ